MLVWHTGPEIVLSTGLWIVTGVAQARATTNTGTVAPRFSNTGGALSSYSAFGANHGRTNMSAHVIAIFMFTVLGSDTITLDLRADEPGFVWVAKINGIPATQITAVQVA
jgi:hypothetical protein